MANGHPAWHWEFPVNMTSTLTTSIIWSPGTFGASNTNNFAINIWLLRGDYNTDTPYLEYPHVILAGNQNVFNSTIEWTPSDSDIDIQGTHRGTHQLAMEHTSDNPKFDPALNNFTAFSLGYNILPVGYVDPKDAKSSTSATPSSTSSPTTSATNTSTSSVGNSGSSGLSQGAAIGIGVGVGCVALLALAAGIWFWLTRQRRKVVADEPKVNDPLSGPPGYAEEASAMYRDEASTRYGEGLPGTENVVSGKKPGPGPVEMDGGWGRGEEGRAQLP